MRASGDKYLILWPQLPRHHKNGRREEMDVREWGILVRQGQTGVFFGILFELEFDGINTYHSFFISKEND